MFSKAQQQALRGSLPQSAIKIRSQGGSRLSYVEGQYVIDALNRIFGFGRWSHTVTELRELYEAQTKTKRGKDAWDVAYRATVRLTITDEGGAICVHEDVGADSAIIPSRGDAHENALKGAVTDALKRAARCMGEQFGLSLYGDLAGEVVVEPVQTKEERLAAALTWALDKGAFASMEEAKDAWARVREDTLERCRRDDVKATWEAISKAWVAEVNAQAQAAKERMEAEREVA